MSATEDQGSFLGKCFWPTLHVRFLGLRRRENPTGTAPFLTNVILILILTTYISLGLSTKSLNLETNGRMKIFLAVQPVLG